MAKKQTRRSISVSRTTYERLKSFCEANNISMSQLVETQVNGFLGDGVTPASAPQDRPSHVTLTPRAPAPSPSIGSYGAPSAPRPSFAAAPIAAPRKPEPERAIEARIERPEPRFEARPEPRAAAPVAPQQVPMTSAAARIAVEPPPPIIKPRQETAAPKPAEKRPDQIFTF